MFLRVVTETAGERQWGRFFLFVIKMRQKNRPPVLLVIIGVALVLALAGLVIVRTTVHTTGTVTNVNSTTCMIGRSDQLYPCDVYTITYSIKGRTFTTTVCNASDVVKNYECSLTSNTLSEGETIPLSIPLWDYSDAKLSYSQSGIFPYATIEYTIVGAFVLLGALAYFRQKH